MAQTTGFLIVRNVLRPIVLLALGCFRSILEGNAYAGVMCEIAAVHVRRKDGSAYAAYLTQQYPRQSYWTWYAFTE